MSYGLNDSRCNQFLGRSWRHILTNSTEARWYWIGVVALLDLFFYIFNFLFILALQYLQPLGKPHAVLSKEALAMKQAIETGEVFELLSRGKSYIGGQFGLTVFSGGLQTESRRVVHGGEMGSALATTGSNVYD